MREETVEIYSDAVNAAIMRHPGRRFPGMLIQGDTLWRITDAIERALRDAAPDSEQEAELEMLAEDMRWRVNFYAQVVSEHGMEFPFPMRSAEPKA